MKCNTLKKLWLMLLLFSLSFIPVFAVNEEAGTTGFANLKNVYSARAIALGQSFDWTGTQSRRSIFQSCGYFKYKKVRNWVLPTLIPL